MRGVYLMAVDLGTTYIKAAVYDTEGKQISSAQAPVNSDSSRPGVFLQSGAEIYSSVLSAMKNAIQLAGPCGADIAAIGFTGQMAGFIGVDRDWNDITSWSCSLDTRYIPYANEQMRTMASQFLEICGTNAPLMSAKCKWFVSEFPKEAEKVAKYMLISSYVIGRLGNVEIGKAAVSSSYLTWTGLADIRSRTWSRELCEASGIRQDLLPEITDYHTVSGYLCAEAAAELGLPAGIPLVAGAGDKIAGCIGAGIVTPGDTIFEASSYGAISVLAEGYTPNPQRYDYDAIPAAEPGQYYLHKYLPGSGITLQWFLDTFGTAQDTEVKIPRAGSQDACEVMEKAISRIPCGSDELMAIGLLGGSAMPFDGEIRGTWTGHTWSHTKAHFYRALLESFAYELRGTMDSIAQMYPEWHRYGDVKMIGGGARSGVWRQILADVTGCTFWNYSGYDAALWGTAVLAGKGIGLFTDRQEAVGRDSQAAVGKSQAAAGKSQAAGGDSQSAGAIGIAPQAKGAAVPNVDNKKKYEKYLAIYEQLRAHMHPVSEKLLAIEREGGKQ